MKIPPVLWEVRYPIVGCYTVGVLLQMLGVGPDWLPAVVAFGGALTVAIGALVLEALPQRWVDRMIADMRRVDDRDGAW